MWGINCCYISWLLFSLLRAIAVAERIFRLDSSHLESHSNNSIYVEDVLYIFSEKIQLSADISNVLQIR